MQSFYAFYGRWWLNWTEQKRGSEAEGGGGGGKAIPRATFQWKICVDHGGCVHRLLCEPKGYRKNNNNNENTISKSKSVTWASFKWRIILFRIDDKAFAIWFLFFFCAFTTFFRRSSGILWLSFYFVEVYIFFHLSPKNTLRWSHRTKKNPTNLLAKHWIASYWCASTRKDKKMNETHANDEEWNSVRWTLDQFTCFENVIVESCDYQLFEWSSKNYGPKLKRQKTTESHKLFNTV